MEGGPAQGTQVVVIDHRPSPSAVRHILSLDPAAPPRYPAFVKALRQALGGNIAGVLLDNQNREVSSSAFDLRHGPFALLPTKSADKRVLIKEAVEFVPHPDTLTASGNYEYHDSQGQPATAFAIAELVDNSLKATRHEKSRNIEILVRLDTESRDGLLCVRDNGYGMDSKGLVDWAIYYNALRERRKEETPKRVGFKTRHLTSDISYFGAGGKQACFHFGERVTMISKTKGEQKVKELVLSKKELEERKQKGEIAYGSNILDRPPKHAQKHHGAYRDLVLKEKGPHFTYVVIDKLKAKTYDFFTSKENRNDLLRCLAMVYHYYIHGPEGNTEDLERHNPLVNITFDFEVDGVAEPRRNLKDQTDDMQTRFIRSASETLDFEIRPDGKEVVEGQLRYHPFLMTSETYPDEKGVKEVDDDDVTVQSAHRRRDIAQAFWNGRFLVSLNIDEVPFLKPDSAQMTKKSNDKMKRLAAGVLDRFSCVLFFDTSWKVTTNKMSLTSHVASDTKDASFHIYDKALGKFQQCTRKFLPTVYQWLENCHKKYDKQIRYLSMLEKKAMNFDKGKNKQMYTKFKIIELDGKKYTVGDSFRIPRPRRIGKIEGFYVRGDVMENSFHSTGLVAKIGITVEMPAEDGVQHVPMNLLVAEGIEMLDTAAYQAEKAKMRLELPQQIAIEFPDVDNIENDKWEAGGGYIEDGCNLPAGSPAGPFKTYFLNAKGQKITTMRINNSYHITLSQEVFQDDKWRVVPNSVHTGHYKKDWDWWFTHFTGNKPGKFRVCFRATSKDGKQVDDSVLPKIMTYNMVAGPPVSFDVVERREKAYRVGTPIDLMLTFRDKFGNKFDPKAIKFSGITFTSEGVNVMGGKGKAKDGIMKVKKLEIHPKQKGSIPAKGMDVKLRVEVLIEEPQPLPEGQETHTLTIRALPGEPAKLEFEDPQVVKDGLTVPNYGKIPIVKLHVFDAFGNLLPSEKDWDFRIDIKGTNKKTLQEVDYKVDAQGRPNDMYSKVVKIKRLNKASFFSLVFNLVTHSLESKPVSLTLEPSTLPGSLHLVDAEANKLPSTVSACAGTTVSNLQVGLWDEGGRPIKLTADLAKHLSASWNNGAKIKSNGRLPTHEMSQTVSKHEANVTYQDADRQLKLNLIFVATKGAPKALRARLTAKEQPWGEELAQPLCILQLTLEDTYENLCDFPDELDGEEPVIDHENVDCTALRPSAAPGKDDGTPSKYFAGLRLRGPLGPGVYTIEFGGFKGRLDCHLVPGPARHIRLASEGSADSENSNELVSYLDSPLYQRLFLTVVDDGGHPMTKGNNVEIRLPRGVQMVHKGFRAAALKKKSVKGLAKFGEVAFRSDPGEYVIKFRIDGKEVDSTLRLIIKEDLHKPTALELLVAKPPKGLVEAPASLQCSAGEPLPTLHARALAKNGDTLKDGAITLRITDQEIMTPTRVDEDGTAVFVDPRAGNHVGTATLAAYYERDPYPKLGARRDVAIVAGAAQALTAEPPPQLETAGNLPPDNKLFAFDLLLADEYGNVCENDASWEGQVIDVGVRHEAASGSGTVPELSVSTLKLIKGRARVAVDVREGSPGNDGLFLVEFKLRGAGQVQPLQCKFHFSNDVQTRQKHEALKAKEMEHAQKLETILASKKAVEEKIRVLKTKLREQETAVAKSQHSLAKTRIPGYNPGDLRTPRGVRASIEQLKQRLRATDDSAAANGRKVLPEEEAGHDGEDVLGRIGRLGFVQDAAACRMLMSIIGDNINVVVCRSRRMADQLRHKSKVLPLETARRAKGKWPKHVPADVSKHGGNYLLNSVQFSSKFEKEAMHVFDILVGDVLFFPNQDSANDYRTAKRGAVGLIVTQDGYKVASSGIYGGGQALKLGQYKRVFPEREKEEYDLISSYLKGLEEHLERVEACAREEADSGETLKRTLLPQVQELNALGEEAKKQKQRTQRELQKLGQRGQKRKRP